MIARVPEWLYEVGFTSIEREAYLYVCMRGACFEDKRKIAKALGVSKTRLWKALGRLEEYGWLKARKAGRSTCYTPLAGGKPLNPNDTNQRTVPEEGHNQASNFPPAETLTNSININVINKVNNNENERDKILAQLIEAGRSKRGTVSKSVSAEVRLGKKLTKI